MLMYALYSGTPAQARQILAAGADANSQFPRGTALGEAIAHDRSAMVRVLLQAGANPDLPSNKRMPLAMACEHGLRAIVQLLLEAGASVKALRDDAKPALLDAASCGCILLAKKLLAAGVPVDFRGKHGRNGTYSSVALPSTWQSALMLAAFYGNPEMVELLIAAGADVNLKDGKGHTAMDYARLLKLPGYGRIVKLLEKAGAVSSNAFEEPVSRIPDFSQAAREPRFNEALSKLRQLTGVKPRTLQQIEGPVPGGYVFPLGETAAWRIVKQHHHRFLKAGSYLFFTRGLTASDKSAVALLPTDNVSKVIAAVGTEGPNDNMYNQQVIAWVERLKREQPIDILGLGHDFVEGYFSGPVKNAEALARKISKVCSEGGDEPAAIRAEAVRLKRDKRLFLWWD